MQPVSGVQKLLTKYDVSGNGCISSHEIAARVFESSTCKTEYEEILMKDAEAQMKGNRYVPIYRKVQADNYLKQQYLLDAEKFHVPFKDAVRLLEDL